MAQLTQTELADIAAKVGRPRGRDARANLDMDLLYAMRAAGFSVRQIAEYLGVSRATVQRRLSGR